MPLESAADSVQRIHVDALTEAGLGPDQPRQLDSQRARERVGESCQKDARFGIAASQVRCAVERDDGLPSPCRARNTCWSAEAALDQFPLRGVEEDRPPLPRILERARQLVHVGHDAEPALRVWVLERIGRRGRRLRLLRCTPGRQLEQCLGGLGGQVLREA